MAERSRRGSNSRNRRPASPAGGGVRRYDFESGTWTAIQGAANRSVFAIAGGVEDAVDAAERRVRLRDRVRDGLLGRDVARHCDRAVELQQFTRRLHEQLSTAEKLRVVEMLWQVALADRILDKHEDHLVRRIAELLYVSHSDLIRIRNRVRG